MPPLPSQQLTKKCHPQCGPHALTALAWRVVRAPLTLRRAHADADTALGEQQGKPEPITAAMSCMDALFDLCQVPSYCLAVLLCARISVHLEAQSTLLVGRNAKSGRMHFMPGRCLILCQVHVEAACELSPCRHCFKLAMLEPRTVHHLSAFSC